jgi:hypothetical protein
MAPAGRAHPSLAIQAGYPTARVLALLRLPLVASDNQRLRHPTEHGRCILGMCPQGRFFSVIRTLPTYHEKRPIKLPSL